MMNRRMREPFHTLMWKASIGYNDSWSQVDPEVLEKFAESIVRECLEQVRDEVQYEYDWKLADAVTKRVLEHFGVE